MMLGADGNRYVRYNYTQQATWNWAVSIGIASGGFGSAAYSGVIERSENRLNPISSFPRFESNPWEDLSIVPCPDSALISGK